MKNMSNNSVIEAEIASSNHNSEENDNLRELQAIADAIKSVTELTNRGFSPDIVSKSNDDFIKAMQNSPAMLFTGPNVKESIINYKEKLEESLETIKKHGNYSIDQVEEIADLRNFSEDNNKVSFFLTSLILLNELKLLKKSPEHSYLSSILAKNQNDGGKTRIRDLALSKIFSDDKKNSLPNYRSRSLGLSPLYFDREPELIIKFLFANNASFISSVNPTLCGKSVDLAMMWNSKIKEEKISTPNKKFFLALWACIKIT